MKQIGLIGAGHLGMVLAKRLVGLGYSVKVANSRGPQTLQEFGLQTGARPVALAEVSTDVEILIISIPFGAIRAIPSTVIDNLPSSGVIVDTGNYVPPRDGAIPEIDSGLSETSWVARQLGAPVVKAFNNITDFSLEHNGRKAGAGGRIALPVSGDDATKRVIVMRLVEALGFTAVDAGALSESWRQQIGQPAYCVDPSLPELERLLTKADFSTVAKNRASSMESMVKMPPDFDKKSLTKVLRFMAGLGRANPVELVRGHFVGPCHDEH